MRHALTVLAALALAACGTIPPDSVAGNFISTEHIAGNFKGAADGATAYCDSRGMVARHLGTDSPVFGRPISRFECVPK